MTEQNARAMVPTWYLFLIAALITLAGACSHFTPPESFTDRLAYAYATQTAVLNTATDQVATGRLSPDEARNLLALSDRAGAVLDTAGRLHELGDPRQAEDQLVLAIALLNELRNYLGRQQ